MSVTHALLVTAANWFDVVRLAAAREPAADLALGHSRDDGAGPLAAVRFDELRAVHQTLGAWRETLTTVEPPPAVAHTLDALVAASRTIVRDRADAILAGAEQDVPTTTATLAFPDLDSPLLAEPARALTFLRSFLALGHSPSLLAWTRELIASPQAAEAVRQRAWLRLLVQKFVVDDDIPEFRSCLAAVYADAEAAPALLSAEAAAIAASGLSSLATLADTLALARPPRSTAWRARGPRRPAPGGGAADITVLVPAYRHEAFIEATLESVLAQTYPAFRIVVVDDRSPDDTAGRAASVADPRITVTVNQTNLGLGDSVLSALERIDTPYVALLNSDDVFTEDRLERCRARLEASPTAHVVATGVIPIDVDDRALSTDTLRPLFDGRRLADWVRWYADTSRVPPAADLVAELLERNFLVTSSNIVARTAFLRACAPALRGLQFCLDWQVFLLAAAAGGLEYDPAPMLGYRLHPSNTVWFDADRAVVYRLEANRVLAAALEAMRPAPGAGDAATAAFLGHLGRAARHSEAHGLAMTAVEVLSGQGLEAACAESSTVFAAVRALLSPPANAHGTRPDDERIRALAWHAAAEVAREEAAVAWRAEGAAQRAARERAAADREHAAALEAERRQSAEQAQRLQAALDSERQEAAERARHLQDALDDARAETARTAADAHAATVAAAAAAAAAQAEAIARLKSAPEWLLGDRLWNRLHLGRIGAPTVRALHEWRDWRNRTRLRLRGLARRVGLARPGAVVAACWSFPIHSQTFVYQEMTALAWTGLDCHVFCCDTNPRSELPAAFAGLWDQRLVMQTDWARGQEDLAHFRRTRPDRVDALLARLADATGRTPEALLQESIVLTGFTFARHVELAGTRYLHTYFFYDQSFIALMAAWLLQIPRGITAYADHMMGDYVFKLVPLHLETADIVVATSARIKRELGEIGGGRFDDKIIVKPNGIDVTRFRHVPAADRLALPGPPQLVAVNRIEPKKGLIHLVDAVDLLRTRGLPVTVNVVGGVDTNTPTSAACHRELVDRIAALGLQESVVLHGVKQQHEFAPIAAGSRLFVAPYVEVGSGDKDGIPTAVLEAMSTGLPIVATDAGSISEAARDGLEGVIVPQRDPAALADAIYRLLTDRDAYVRLADGARERAVTEFDIHVTERRLHERIRPYLDGGAAARA
ncbi:MAG: glycosyltransferase [Vicinamibacterales bacterium]